MTLFAFFGLGTMELAAIAVLGVLLFGKRLPEMSRSFGKMFVDFKKGLSGMQDEVKDVQRSFLAEDRAAIPGAGPAAPSIEPARPPKRVTAAGPKFEDPA